MPLKKIKPAKAPLPAPAPEATPPPPPPADGPVPYPVFADHNRHVVCIFSRGVSRTYYLGLDGPGLTTLEMATNEFERQFRVCLMHKTAIDFAKSYVSTPKDKKFLPISGSAYRVLKSILGGSGVTMAQDDLINHLESNMAKAETAGEAGFKKPDGPVAQVHKYLDKFKVKIEAGKLSRKAIIDDLVTQGYSAGTVSTQAGVWARLNGITFTRPAAEAEKPAAKKAAAKKAPAKKAAPARKPKVAKTEEQQAAA